MFRASGFEVVISTSGHGSGSMNGLLNGMFSIFFMQFFNLRVKM